MKVATFILLCLAIVSCKEEKKEAMSGTSSHENFSKGHGTVIDSLEVGRWSYTKSGKVVSQGRYESGYKKGTWNYRNDNIEFSVEWDIYQDSEITINHPKEWILKEKSDYLFYALPKQNKNDFFLVLQHHRDSTGFNLNSYVEHVIEELFDSSGTKLLNHSFFRLQYPQREAYFFHFLIEEDKGTMQYFTFYTEDDENVYDFTYKSVYEENTSIEKRKVFGAVVYSSSIGNKKLFYEEDKLIDYNKLEL